MNPVFVELVVDMPVLAILLCNHKINKYVDIMRDKKNTGGRNRIPDSCNLGNTKKVTERISPA